jgi:hypothetical protein
LCQIHRKNAIQNKKTAHKEKNNPEGHLSGKETILQQH